MILPFCILYFSFALFSRCDLDIKSSAVPGSTTFDLLARVENDVLSQQPDMVVMMIGTNDMVNSAKLSSYQEFSDNVDRLIQYFRANRIEPVLVSPPPVDSIYLFQRHNREVFDESPNVRLRTANAILQQKAKEYQLAFVDIFSHFKALGIPSHDQDSVIRNYANSGVKDGVHPTAAGYEMIAEQICKVLRSNNKIRHGKFTIICFGDSITWGSGVEGKGTATGQTYPAFLKRKLCGD